MGASDIPGLDLNMLQLTLCYPGSNLIAQQKLQEENKTPSSPNLTQLCWIMLNLAIVTPPVFCGWEWHRACDMSKKYRAHYKNTSMSARNIDSRYRNRYPLNSVFSFK